jgi:uncharacterized protein YqgV (UPF0045/DUF77 family)
VIVEIECVPQPLGTEERPYAHVDAAIGVIAGSGLKYEVGALGTTLEGEPDEVWPLLRRVHEACVEAGAHHVLSVVKIAQAASGERQATMDGLTGPHRS